MINVTKNQKGIAHYLLPLIVIVVIAVGAVGYRVFHHKQAVSSVGQSSNSDVGQSSKLTSPKKVTVDTKGSAAATAAKTNSSSQVQTVNYDLSTPDGTLNQLGVDLNNGSFDLASYYVTPRIYFRTTELLNLPGDASMSSIGNACKQNTICNLGLKTTSLPTNYSTDSFTYPASGTSGKILTTQLSSVDKAASLIYGNLPVNFYMVGYDNNTKWVLDKITIGSYTL